ncbi:TPA: oligosaccharide flippase family protein [Vibrio parahaemolyticus]|uniref:Polysaccharide biosynthesis protein n=2 Tax=Vibrio parahaemolyticus TaxID=670 RepID=A0A5P4S845_VIBPH|nr:oligosaccharide flippase family protein [Vibrio parahaemolyticus]EJG0632081.1 oligosaccharide flippase family protein [Vibrio parahaemolyticus]EJG0737711.1 oligosaccharide flippase family protein [Vibrio parahaemolyticus]EJG0916179.1 oligosaccharide flippase family protein [Vibrio parahaemolyticus]MDF4704742.1 oligosaccharide flippase family protein [Vibrio parahaemolyticus]MDZ5177693.1 oligosaccharide flippase family protein [Vibrio parahaemolyticus]
MKSTVLRNASSLYLVKFSGYLIPIITLPYLTRVLGPEYFGYSALAIAISHYFVIFSNYGFDLTATARIAKINGRKKQISNVFWHVIIIKMAIFLFGLAIILFVIFILPLDEVLKRCLLPAYFLVLGTVIFPQWLFQGMQRLSNVSILSTVIRLLSVPIILLVVKSQSDVYKYLWVNSTTNIVIGLLSLFMVYKLKWVSIVRIKYSYLKGLIFNGWHVFVSILATTLYTSSVTVILGIFVGPASVGVFASANKLTQMAQSIYQPLSAAIYPKIVSTLSLGKESVFPLVKKLILFQIVSGGSIFIIFFFFSENIISIVFGSEYSASVEVLEIIAITPLLIGLSNILGVQLLLPLGFRRQFSQVIVVSGMVGLMASIVGAVYFAEIGAAIAVTTTELLVLLLMVYKFKRLT